jgi:hypothetical protein
VGARASVCVGGGGWEEGGAIAPLSVNLGASAGCISQCVQAPAIALTLHTVCLDWCWCGSWVTCLQPNGCDRRVLARLSSDLKGIEDI